MLPSGATLFDRGQRPLRLTAVGHLLHEQAVQLLARVDDVRAMVAAASQRRRFTIGLVAAEEGVAIVPESVRRSRSEDIAYRWLVEEATSPIIMSRRVGDTGRDLWVLDDIIARKYRDWGYEVPEALLVPRG